MTTTIAASLAEYTDAELCEFYGSADASAGGWRDILVAEMDRRDQETAKARARQARRDEPVHVDWETAAYAQYLEAQRVTCGNLALREAPFTDAFSLWSGTEAYAMRWATEELRRYWLDHPRVTITAYREQVRGQREAYRSELESDEPGRVRRDAGTREAGTEVRADSTGNHVPGPDARARAQDSEPAGAAARSGGAVRRGGLVDTTSTTTGSRQAELAARAKALRERELARARSGGPDASEDEPGNVTVPAGARESARASLAVREPSPVVWGPEPQDQVNGAELLGHIAGYFGTYAAFPSVGAHVTVTLWNGHAAARLRDDTGIGPLIWRATPRLCLTSSENKSGKSTVLDLSRYLHRVQRPVKITGRALAHKLGRKHEPVFLDEVKLLFGAGRASQEVQGVLLAGYTPGATWDYARGNADVSIPCGGPVAYAAKDELLTATGEQLVDLFDRTIFVRMKRPVALMPQPDEQAEDDGRLLGESLIGWTDSVRDKLKARSRELAELDYQASQAAADDGREVDARQPQIWRPLLAVADIAGGPWPSLARQAMRELTAGEATLEAAARMGQLRERARHWAPVGFLSGAAGEDYTGEDEF